MWLKGPTWGMKRMTGMEGHPTDVTLRFAKAPGFPGGSEVKASAHNAGGLGLIPGLGRSPGEGNGNPLQYACLENPMDGGAWWATVHRVTKSRTRLSDFTFTFTLQISNNHGRIIIKHNSHIYIMQFNCSDTHKNFFITKLFPWDICVLLSI